MSLTTTPDLITSTYTSASTTNSSFTNATTTTLPAGTDFCSFFYRDGTRLYCLSSIEPADTVSENTTGSSTTRSSTPSSSTSLVDIITSVEARPSQTLAAQPSRSNINTGALAGAAVGGVVTGALIAGLIFFFFIRWRMKPRPYMPRSSYISASDSADKGDKGTPLVSISAVDTLDFLPQQADDTEVRRRVSTIIDNIDQYVENFYTNRTINVDRNLERELARFETSCLPMSLPACLHKAIVPTVLIKHCLIFHIFNLTVGPAEGTQTLLPPDLASMIVAVYFKCLSPSTSKDFFAAFSSWKSLTFYLRPNLVQDSTKLNSTIDSISRIATHFTSVFSPWSNAGYSDEYRTRHLAEIVSHAIETATWLFGQPDNFQFEWRAPLQDRRQSNLDKGTRCAIIAPTVWKMTHQGVRLGGQGQLVLDPLMKTF